MCIYRKKIFIKIVYVFIIFSFVFCLHNIRVFSNERTPLVTADRRISMDFKDANLKDVLKAFSQQSGLNFVASEGIEDRKITLYFEGVRVQHALNRILEANNLTYDYTPESEIFLVKPTGREEVETVTRIYTLNYANIGGPLDDDARTDSDIIPILERMLTRHGNIMGYKRTNSLIIRDVPAQFPLIEQTIAKLDTRTSQVMIEAEILETSINLAERLGVGMKYEGSRGRVEVVPFHEADLGDFTPTGISLPTDSSFLGVLSRSQFKGILDMLETEGRVRYLARPRVLSLNNETAEINIATWESIGVETVDIDDATRRTVESAEREWVGTKLKVTPQINKEGFIVLNVEPEVSRTQASRLADSFRDVFKKSAQTKVMVRDGETVVIGGLTTGYEIEDRRKVPFLGDIPVLGWLFKGRRSTDEKKELVIFITPHIIKSPVYDEEEVAETRRIIRETSSSFRRPEVVTETRETLERKPSRTVSDTKTEDEIRRSREEEIQWVLDQMSQ